MTGPQESNGPKGLSIFERYLTLWVALCIVGGIILGKAAPGFAKYLDSLAIYVGNAPVVSIPIAICLFFMMYPIMVKIDFAEVLKAGKSIKPVGLTLFVNWAIKPFTMYAISLLIQTNIIFWLGYGLAKLLKLEYRDAAPSAMIGASNHFEVAIATAVMLFGLSSGAALATVVGVLIEVPVMLMLVRICLKTQHWFKAPESRTAALERS